MQSPVAEPALIEQLIPVPVTVPVPTPAPVIVRVRKGLNVAVQVLSAFIVTEVGLLVPEQLPLHPAKTELAPAMAVSCTTVPWL